MHKMLGTLAAIAIATSAYASTSVEKVNNDKVKAFEETLQPGEAEKLRGPLPSVIVYMSSGRGVHEGETVFEPPDAAPLKNNGTAPLHFVRIYFLTPGGDETWGTSGLAPHYKMLFENQYVRAYDIKIPAQSREPQHSHHDRVVISLSGAQLEHILPDGTVQPSTLKTGEVVWRKGGTHIGHNMGETDLWVIAVEPK